MSPRRIGLDSAPGRWLLAAPAPVHGVVVQALSAWSLLTDAGGSRSRVPAIIGRALGQQGWQRWATNWGATTSACRYALDSALALYGPPQAVRRINSTRSGFDGLQHLQQALAGGQGVLLTASFFAAFAYALMCPWPADAADLHGLKLNLVVPRADPMFLRLQARVRELAGRELALIEMGQPAAALLVTRALRRNEAVVCMIDHVPDGAAITLTDLFGHPACLPAGFLLLAARQGTPVVNCCTLRRQGRFVTVFDPVLDPRAAPGDDTLGWLSQALARQLEARVRHCPQLWNAWPSLGRKWELADSLAAASSSSF